VGSRSEVKEERKEERGRSSREVLSLELAARSLGALLDSLDGLVGCLGVMDAATMRWGQNTSLGRREGGHRADL